MDKEGNILDYLNAKPDLENQIIKTVGNPRYRLKEDSLRILRAIRLATILNFQIDPKAKHYITKYANYLKNLSYQRKKQELDKIFTSKSKEKGINLLIELKIDEALKLPKLKQITACDDLIGIWTQLNVDELYPFTKVEKQQMKKIRAFLAGDIHDQYNLYQYGLYTSTVAYQIKKEDIFNLNKIYQQLPIHTSKEIKIETTEIAKLLNKKPGNYLKEIITDIEKRIIYQELDNEKEKIKQYILNNYSSTN